MFSTATKVAIYERLESRRSELSGSMERPLECSHLTHDKSLPEYDTPEMGVLCTDIEHYVYHLIFKMRPEEIGLTRSQNDWSIKEIWQRVTARSFEMGMDRDQLNAKVAEARAYWYYYLGVEG